jgi:hypothetical protein
MINPRHIEKFNASGKGNMATLADDQTAPRFNLDRDVQRFALVYMRLVIQGGTGDADLKIYMRHRFKTGDFDFLLFDYSGVRSVGSTRPVFDLRIQAHELMHYTFDRDANRGAMDQIVPVWTNPDSGNMNWAWEVGLIDVVDI